MLNTNNNDLYITFLRSEHGGGFVATVREDLFEADAEANYGHLKGNALALFLDTPFKKAVAAFLKEHGVTFYLTRYAAGIRESRIPLTYIDGKTNYAWAKCGQCGNTVKFAPKTMLHSVCAGCDRVWNLESNNQYAAI